MSLLRRPEKILFVGMHHSIHTARWLESVYPCGFELHFFPIDPAEPHAYLRNLVLYKPEWSMAHAEPVVPVSAGESRTADAAPSALTRAIRFARLARRDPGEAQLRLRDWMNEMLAISRRRQTERSSVFASSAPANGELRLEKVPVAIPSGAPHDPDRRIRLGHDDESDATAPALHGPEVLARVIKILKPDLIHSMEYQHSAYLVLAARDLLKRERPNFDFPRWLATNWGSDIFLFGRDEKHARQIRRVNEAIDLYSCECGRDLEIGRRFGYLGPAMPVLPNSGGIDVVQAQTYRSTAPPSKRKLIMVKGYDHFAGRAMISLAVVEKYADRLKDYEIVMFSVGVNPRVRALELKAAGTLNIKVIDWAPHDEILEHFGRARMYLGISISDGISTSVLEAMMMGAFPIQTNTSCCEEWFVPGETGLAVSPDDFEQICSAFERALTDDDLVDRAAPRNFDIIRSRLDRSVIDGKVREFYERALSSSLKSAAGRSS